jgi:uncharacterized membrane protein
MNIALWIVQGLLGAMFMFAGLSKLFQPKEKLKDRMPWVNDFSAGTVKFVGMSEMLGGIGLVVPWATHIVPVLTPIAGIGLAIIMILAGIYHLGKDEYRGVIICSVLLLLNVFIAYGRLKLVTS